MTDLRRVAERTVAAEEQAEREERIAAIEREMLADQEARERTEREAQTRSEAAEEAGVLARERYALAEEVEQAAANLNRCLAEYESLHRKQVRAMARASREVGGTRLHDTLTLWFRHRFGGHDSLTGTPAPHYADTDRPLPERDRLAEQG